MMRSGPVFVVFLFSDTSYCHERRVAAGRLLEQRCHAFFSDVLWEGSLDQHLNT